MRRVADGRGGGKNERTRYDADDESRVHRGKEPRPPLSLLVPKAVTGKLAVGWSGADMPRGRRFGTYDGG